MTLTGRITWRGLTLGTGSPYGVTSVEGWEDLPDLADDSEAYPYDDGESVGLLRAGGRTVTVEGYVYDRDAAAGSVIALAASTYKDRNLALLTVEQYGRTLTAAARVTRRALPQGLSYGRGWQPWTLQFRCPDPRRYLPGVGDLSVGLPTSSGGITLPATLPATLGVATSSGRLFLPNAGQAPYRPVLTLRGPLPNGAAVTHLETGRVLRYEGPLAAGDVLTLDSARRRVRLAGTDRRGSLTVAQWLEVPAGGATLVWSSLGTDLDPAARLTAIAPPAGAVW